MLSRETYSKSSKKITDKIRVIHNNKDRATKYNLNLHSDTYTKQEVKGKNYLLGYTSHELKLSEYFFYSFVTLEIGKLVALDEEHCLLIEGVRINYCDFQDCKISNIVFRRCCFGGTSFNKVTFDNVIFDSCIFSSSVFEKEERDINNIYMAPTIFENCIFFGKFRDCDIEYSLFDNVVFTQTKYEKCSLQDSVFVKCFMTGIEIKDCDLCNFSIYKTDILDIKFTDERKSIANENTFIDYKIYVKKDKNSEEITSESGWKYGNYENMSYEKAKSIRAISKVFEINGLLNMGGEYFYQAKLLEHKAIKGLPKLISTIELITCGYGERPSFTFTTILTTTLLFGTVYMFTGINVNGYSIDYIIGNGYPVSFIRAITDFGKCLYYSIITGTVGVGNYIPIGLLSMVLSSLQMVLGISLYALWTGCIFRKIAR